MAKHLVAQNPVTSDRVPMSAHVDKDSLIITKDKPHPEYYDFPQGFKWSTATAAFQIEGATREDGRGPSVWDEYTRKAGKIRDNTTADVTSDSYHKFREDIALMKSLGVTHYRFSISWSRIFPTGVGKPNPKGVQYYHDVIDTLVKNGIKPM
ncbi:glycosyl hydrolase, family 1, partial [Ancylostoma duodenale]